MHRNRLVNLAKYAVSIGIIGAILWEADHEDLLSVMKEVDILFFGTALLLQALNIVVRGYKWQLLMNAQGAVLPLGAAIRLTLMSVFFNNLFLGSIGGDVFRVYRGSSYSESRGSVASSVIMERFSGFFTIILMVLVFGVIYLLLPGTLVSSYTLIALALLALTVLIGSLLAVRFSSIVLGLPVARRFPKIARFTDAVIASFWSYRNKQGAMASALLLSVLYQLSRGAALFFVVLAVNLHVPLLAAAFIELLVSIALMIPLSVHGIGLQEGSYILYLDQLGIETTTAFLVALLMRASAMSMSVLGGLLFLADSDKRVPAPRASSGGNN